MQRDLIGAQLKNYRLISMLGKGGFAEVYLGEHLRLSSRVAIKVLHAHLPIQESQQFLREAQVIASLRHPHIVRVLDFDVHDSLSFLIMDYYPRGTLRRLHPVGSVLPPATVAIYTQQMADALQYAHDQKLIHRDVKPENMLVGQQGEIVLSDFGIATIAHNTSSLSVQMPIGTIAYMAPEQIQGEARTASDQYALAVIVYEWLCGKRPFSGTYAEVLAKHLTMAPPSLCQQRNDITPAIEQVVFTALAKDPHQRYGSIQEFAAALHRASQPASVSQQSTTFLVHDVMPLPVSPVQVAAQSQPLEPLPSADQAESVASSVASTTVADTPRPDSDVPSTPTLSAPLLSNVPPLRLTGKALAGRAFSPGIIVGAAIILLIGLLSSGLLVFRTLTGNRPASQPALQINATATALASDKTALAATNADAATASAQQTTISAGAPATATAFVHATATAVALDKVPDYFVGKGKMFYNEALNSPGDHWVNSTSSQANQCQFLQNSYHVSMSKVGFAGQCINAGGEISGGPEQVEVAMMIVKGDCAALGIRYSKTTAYTFFVCQDGHATISSDMAANHVLGRVSPGSFQLKASWNTMALEVSSNNTIMGYVNGQRVITVPDDNPNAFGEFAVGAVSLKTATEVAFRNLRAWG